MFLRVICFFFWIFFSNYLFFAKSLLSPNSNEIVAQSNFVLYALACAFILAKSSLSIGECLEKTWIHCWVENNQMIYPFCRMYALILVCIGSCIYNRQCFLLVESLYFDENRDSCQKQQTAAYTKSIPLLHTAVDLFSELVLLSLELINTDSFIYSLFFALIFFSPLTLCMFFSVN